MKNNIHFANIGNLSRELKNKTISPVELVEHMLSRIESVDQRLNSYATICADRAIKEARQAEREILAGKYRGRLHGVPIVCKRSLLHSRHPNNGWSQSPKELYPFF